MKILAFTLCFFSSFFGFSQMLDNRKGEAFTDEPFFNISFIKANKIKALKGTFTVKKMGDILRDTELIRNYFFDEEGRLIKTFETTQSSLGFDTLVTFFEYDEFNRLTAKRSSDRYGFYATHFSYDSESRIIKKEIRRNLKKRTHKDNFDLGREFVVTFETYSYQRFEDQIKKIVFNSYDIPFKEVIYYYDEDSVLIAEKETIKRTSAVTRKEYFYNDFGYMDSIHIHSPKSSVKSKTFEFEYDDYNNLKAKQYYKDGVHTTDHQIIYDSKTTLLKFILVKEVATSYITILDIKGVEYF